MMKNIITVGLFDQTTKKQEITKEEAVKALANMIVNRGYCATMQTEGITGIYRHADGTVVIEPSIRVEIAGPDRADILPLVHDIRVAFNQESVMLESIETPIDFIDIEYK